MGTRGRGQRRKRPAGASKAGLSEASRHAGVVAALLSCGSRRGSRTLRQVLAILLAGVCLGAVAVAAHATDATWSAAPPNNNWNDGANWTSIPPHTVPDGTASFGESTQKSIVFSSNFTSIGSMNFSATAPLYTFAIAGGQGFVVVGTGTVDSQGAGGGIANNSSFAPTFLVTGALTGISFNNFATASNANFTISSGANLQFFNNAGAAASITNTSFGSTSFFNNSSSSSPILPGQAVFGSVIVNDSGGTTSFFAQSNAFGTVITNNLNGSTKFFDSSTAFNATITNNTNGVTIFGNSLGNDAASAGQATILNNSGGRTDFNASSIADHATITTISGGLTNFNDMSTADHATITNDGGQTIFGPNSKAGSAQITNQNGGQTIFFGTAASATITNTSAGQTVFAASGRAGSANITNTQSGGPGAGGTTQFFDSSTADHATITNSNSGSTSFFNSSMAGNATITNQNNASTSFADASTADNATILNKLGGIVLFRGNSTAGNATITNDGGATTFIDNSCVGTATITAINGGFINYAQSGACPTPGPKPKIIVGQGSKIDISGLLIPGITFGSIEGLGTIVLGSKALTVGSNDLSTEFAGVIADGGTSGGTGGSLVKVGNGMLILSGADIYTGPTSVNAGILNVNGSLASTVFVNSGGTLMGNGFIGGLVVGPGATVAPGNSIGTLTVNGNVIFQSGSFYQVEANAAGQSDKIVASGAATLAGGTVQVLAENQAYARQTRYMILTANGGVTGTFAGVTSNLAFLTPTLSYDPNDVFLTLNRNDITFASVAQTPNQRAVAGALDRSPLFSPLVEAVVNLTGPSALRAFDALSGEIHGSVQPLYPPGGARAAKTGAICKRHRRDGRARHRWTHAGLCGFLRFGGFRLGLRGCEEVGLPDQGPAARRSGANPRPHLLGARRRRLGQDRQRRQRRRCRPQPRRLLHRLRSPLRRVALGCRRRLHQFEPQRERARKFGQYRHRLSRGLCGDGLRRVEFPLGRDLRLEHDRRQPFDRLPRLRRAGERALWRRRRPSVRRAWLRHDLRRHCGRAVRGARLGAPRYQELHRNRRRERAYRHGQQGRRRLLYPRTAGGDLLPLAKRHGAHPARIGRLAARLGHGDAGRGACLPEHGRRLWHRRRAACARRRADRGGRRSPAHHAGEGRRLLRGPARQQRAGPFGQRQFHLAVLT
jgi:autotransporter-associated beta strand protein